MEKNEKDVEGISEMNLIQIADYYTRLRLAGMSEHEIVIFKKAVFTTAMINNVEVSKLIVDCVSFYEEKQAKDSLLEESKFSKGMLEVNRK